MVSNPGPCRDQRLSTTDFSYCTESCHLQKLSDYSAAVGCNRKSDEEDYKTVVGNLGDAKRSICILTWQRLNVGCGHEEDWNNALGLILKASLS